MNQLGISDDFLQRVQLSAFCGELNSHDREVLLRELPNFIDGERDRIYVVPLCDRCVRLWRAVAEKSVEIVGKEESRLSEVNLCIGVSRKPHKF
jgi:CRISPR-associated endonuclease Cas2